MYESCHVEEECRKKSIFAKSIFRKVTRNEQQRRKLVSRLTALDYSPQPLHDEPAVKNRSTVVLTAVSQALLSRLALTKSGTEVPDGFPGLEPARQLTNEQ